MENVKKNITVFNIEGFTNKTLMNIVGTVGKVQIERFSDHKEIIKELFFANPHSAVKYAHQGQEVQVISMVELLDNVEGVNLSSKEVPEYHDLSEGISFDETSGQNIWLPPASDVSQLYDQEAPANDDFVEMMGLNIHCDGIALVA